MEKVEWAPIRLRVAHCNALVAFVLRFSTFQMWQSWQCGKSEWRPPLLLRVATLGTGKAQLVKLPNWNKLENDVNIKQWGGGWGIRCEGYYWLHHHHATPLGDRPDIETSWTSCMHIFQSMSVHTDFVQQSLLCSKSKFLPWSFGLNGGRLAKISIKWVLDLSIYWNVKQY